MRRPVLIAALLAALALPATALALQASPNDGTLVVKDAAGPGPKTPVVTLNITGVVIGQITGFGRIVIDPGPNNANVPEVTGYDTRKDVAGSDTAQTWSGTDFKFRAVGGHWTILIYGSDVDVVAFGHGPATLTGETDDPKGDGTYSLNGESVFHSLPGITKTVYLTSAD